MFFKGGFDWFLERKFDWFPSGLALRGNLTGIWPEVGRSLEGI